MSTWLGRVHADGGAPCWVRAATPGAPGPDDVVEEIPAPTGADLRAHVMAATPRRQLTVGDVRLAPPVLPSKILCVGRNYRAHAQEMGNEVPTEPLLFFKPPSALVASGDPVMRPQGYERVDMEAELVAVIGRRGRAIAAADALDYVAGYTLGNDVSNRDLQRRDKQWTRAKGFDTFAPLGPFVRLMQPGEPLPGTARIQGWLDGELRQDAPLSAMVFDVAAVIAHVSACMTLEPGDVIYTGTPSGVSPLSPGQTTAASLAGFDLGQLSNPVVVG